MPVMTGAAQRNHKITRVLLWTLTVLSSQDVDLVSMCIHMCALARVCMHACCGYILCVCEWLCSCMCAYGQLHMNQPEQKQSLTHHSRYTSPIDTSRLSQMEHSRRSPNTAHFCIGHSYSMLPHRTDSETALPHHQLHDIVYHQGRKRV